MKSINLDFIRSQFPSLAGEWIFMDNAGGSQVLQTVANRVSDYLINSNVQLGASYEISRISTERVHEAPKMVAEFINAKEQSEIIIGPSTTLLIRILALSLAQTFKPGDEIVVTNCDHEANIGAWVELEKMGLVIKKWKINQDSFEMELNDLEILLTGKTKLVAVTHTSNILGTLNPIKQIAQLVHSYGALICVDGVAHAPHRIIDVRDSDVDFYAFSFYKTFGPHIAMLYGKKELLLKIPGVCHFFVEPDNIPYKFQPGSPNYELSYGLLGIKDYFFELTKAHSFTGHNFRESAEFCYKLIADHEEILAEKLLNYLNSKRNVKIIGSTSFNKDKRVPTISFTVKDRMSDSIIPKVDAKKIGIRYGDFYARRLIDDLGLAKQNGVVRVSLVHYNTLDEIEKLINVFEQIF
ncbi:MAG: cysteine desulfurase-like protein [Ignavibacteriae bacterium HGW-Ignavibacteriae-3]|nr:MAG: cysteine desulfurase-like protein [Ignavibacteriae bacterium HGW-Ignavibacteriae-3]